MKRTFVLASLLSVTLCASTAWGAGVLKTYKYDQFDADLTTAANQVQGMSLATQPGFAQGEAFGQIYRPAAVEYPIKILGFDIILAAPPDAGEVLTTHAQIEVYNSDSDGPDPGAPPVWSMSTQDLLDPQDPGGSNGIPLQGNVGMHIEFDWEVDPEGGGHPPMILDGNIWLVIRFPNPAKSMEYEWDSQCAIIMGFGCGCQNVGTLHDQVSTPEANIIHYYTPMGDCDGPGMAWSYMNTVGVTGDVLMRMNAEVSGEVCTPQCSGKECGNDGCGDVCGECDPGETCNEGVCETGPCSPNCDGKQCGDDGCGDVCGTCSGDTVCIGGLCKVSDCNPPCQSGYTCIDGTCTQCTPDCTGKVCGSDGCGGSCGPCGSGQVCDSGACVDESLAGPKIISITPYEGKQGEEVDVTIYGERFHADAEASIGGKELMDIDVSPPNTINGTVRSTMDPLRYDVIVTNPDGKSDILVQGFEVIAAVDSTCGDGLCAIASNETCQTCPIDCCPGGGGTASDCRAASGGSGPWGLYLAPLALLALISLVGRFGRRA